MTGWHGHCPIHGNAFRLWSNCPAWRFCRDCEEKVIINSCHCSERRRRFKRRY